MKSVLYRHFSEDGTLLYVGASLNVLQRQIAHVNQASWFEQVAKITFQRFENRSVLLAAEHAAIAAECPLYNYRSQRKRPTKKPAFVAPVEVIPFEKWGEKEQKKYLKLRLADRKAIRRDSRLFSTVAFYWKINLNTVFFIKEGRVPQCT